jgi:hypothetical protein
MRIPLLASDGRLNPFESRCQLAKNLVVRDGVLRPAPGATRLSSDSAQTLVVADQLYWDTAATGFAWGDAAFFPGAVWKVKKGTNSYTLSVPPTPTVRSSQAFYERYALPNRWLLSGSTGGANAVPNGNFQQGGTGWTTLAGTVQYGWSGVGYTAWFRGGGHSGATFPYYAGFRSNRFPIDKERSYFLSYLHICEPYNRYTYDNSAPRLIVRVFQYDAAGNLVGTNPILEDQVDSTRLHDTRPREWHRHKEFAGTIHAASSTSTPRWHPNAAQAAVEVWCNFNKHRITDIALTAGVDPVERVVEGRLIYEWTFPASADGANIEVFTKCAIETASLGSLRLGLLRVRGLTTTGDDAVQFVLQNELGEEYVGRIIGYGAKDAVAGELNEVVWRDVEIDLTPLQGSGLVHFGISATLAALPTGQYQVQVGSVLTDAGDSESGSFALLLHGRVPKGVQRYALTQVVTAAGYELESAPVEFEVSLRQFSYHSVRVAAEGTGTLRLYRLVDGLYQRVAERSGSGELIDRGEVGAVYQQSGLLPDADLSAVWLNRVVLAKRGTRVVYLSGENEPLRYAETGLGEFDAQTIILPEAVSALDARVDGVVIYGQTRAWFISKYIPLLVFETKGLEPAAPKAVHQGYVADATSLYAPRGKRLRWLPPALSPPTVVRVGLDGTLLIGKGSLVELLTDAGWIQLELAGSVQDAAYVDNGWYVATTAGVYRLLDGAPVAGVWRSGRFTAEGYTRPVWVWVLGKATVLYRDAASTERTARVEWGRWQVPVSQASRWWEIELQLQPNTNDVVYQLMVEAERVGGIR